MSEAQEHGVNFKDRGDGGGDVEVMVSRDMETTGNSHRNSLDAPRRGPSFF